LQVISSLGSKKLLPEDQVADLEASLANRDDNLPDASTRHEDTAAAVEDPTRSSLKLKKPNGVPRLDTKQIEQRLEEDRERHKRLRESMWAVSGKGDDEFDKLWRETSPVAEDDYLEAQEQAAERDEAVKCAKRAHQESQLGPRPTKMHIVRT
jgi:CTD kinase subunit gamma